MSTHPLKQFDVTHRFMSYQSQYTKYTTPGFSLRHVHDRTMTLFLLYYQSPVQIGSALDAQVGAAAVPRVNATPLGSALVSAESGMQINLTDSKFCQ